MSLLFCLVTMWAPPFLSRTQRKRLFLAAQHRVKARNSTGARKAMGRGNDISTNHHVPVHTGKGNIHLQEVHRAQDSPKFLFISKSRAPARTVAAKNNATNQRISIFSYSITTPDITAPTTTCPNTTSCSACSTISEHRTTPQEWLLKRCRCDRLQAPAATKSAILNSATAVALFLPPRGLRQPFAVRKTLRNRRQLKKRCPVRGLRQSSPETSTRARIRHRELSPHLRSAMLAPGTGQALVVWA